MRGFLENVQEAGFSKWPQSVVKRLAGQAKQIAVVRLWSRHSRGVQDVLSFGRQSGEFRRDDVFDVARLNPELDVVAGHVDGIFRNRLKEGVIAIMRS